MNSKVTPAPAGPPLTADELAAIERLDRVRGVGGLKSALLALLASPAVPGRLRTWREETVLVPEAEVIRVDIGKLGPSTRLPWFELLLARMGAAPLADRQELLKSARRVLGPPGLPIDRLLWLAMRRHFGEHPLTPAHGANDPELSRLSIAELLHVAHFTAHLARMVIDPWGEVLAVRPEGEGVVLAELDTARIAEVRAQLPALSHRRC